MPIIRRSVPRCYSESGRFEPALFRCECGATMELSDPLDNVCECGACFNMSGQAVIHSSQCDEQGEPYDRDPEGWY